MPSMAIQAKATQSFETFGGETTTWEPLRGTSIEVTRTTSLVGPSEPKIRILKLEMPEKHSSRVADEDGAVFLADKISR